MKVVEQFKRRILDLAIRGKLVPQDPNDEPASILLERIKAEKAKLVKAGKIKKVKNPSEIVIGSDGAAYEKFGSGDLSHAETRRRGVDVPFDLPQGWAWARLDSLCHSIADGDHQAPPQEISGIPFLVISNVSNGVLDFSNTRFVGEDYYKSLKTTRIPSKGDILVTVTGSYGIIVRVDTDRHFCFQRHIALLKCCGNGSDYLFNALQSNIVKRYFDAIATGTAQKTVALNHLRNTLIPIPPLAEQKRIVAKIDELFAIADSLGTAADGLENAAKRLDKKILDLAIRGRLVPQDPNDEPASELLKCIAASHKSPCKNQSEHIDPPFAIPQSWEWVRLGTITNYGQCKSIDAKSILPDTWLLDLEEIEKDTGRLLARRTAAEKKSSSSKHVFCRGMVLYSKLRTYLNKVLVADMDGVSTSEIVPISVVDGVCPEYLCLALTSQYFLQYTASRGYGVKMPRVGTNDMRSALIPLPPLNEQKRIVKRVEDLKATTRTLVTF